MKKGWLYSFLVSCVGAFSDREASARLQEFERDNPDLNMDERIRRWVEYRLRQTGVVYGTPLSSEDTIARYTEKGSAQRRAVFLALLKIEADLAMEIGCAVSHCTSGNIRVAELLACFALLRRRFELARSINDLLPSLSAEGAPPRKLEKLADRVGVALMNRAYLAGNPLLGLPIHNSFNYMEAKTLGRLAVAYFERGFAPEAIQRVLDFGDRERALLVRAMVGLTLADRDLGVGSMRVVAEQIRSSGLSHKTRKKLLDLLKGPVEPLAVASAVEDDRTRDFLLEQVILGAMLDGHFSRKESDYIGDLAGWLGVSGQDLAQRETEVMEFYELHKDYLDIFTVGSAVSYYRQRMAGRLQRAITENLGMIIGQIKETKDLADLLYRASSGEKLSAGERKEMARKLVDILKTIPSLAIFALPGGMVLLPLVYKFLPNGLKPRIFAKRESAKD
ncbi:MAG TPA: hypothetical protein VM425_03555 [Myxococcota bacterium]|nr:hypothetical protein [Myxococcota bacterium]